MKLWCPQGQIIDVKFDKSQLISHFDFFSAIIELVWELVIFNMHNKFCKEIFSSYPANK